MSDDFYVKAMNYLPAWLFVYEVIICLLTLMSFYDIYVSASLHAVYSLYVVSCPVTPPLPLSCGLLPILSIKKVR